VRIPTSLGTRFLQYSFAPGASIINAFLQTLIGLYDYAKVSGDPRATALFNAGNAEALAEVPSFDTGAWSLYQPGLEDTLGYHQLVTGFLQQLCTRTAAPVYCTTAQHFQADLTTAPVLSLLTGRARVHKPTSIRFRLSKISRVGIIGARGEQRDLLHERDFRARGRLVLDPPTEAHRRLHGAPQRDRSRRQLQPDRRDAVGFTLSRRTRTRH